MRDVIIVPSYFRSEFLYLCLEAIYAAKGSDKMDVWICHDRKHDDLKQFANDLSDIETVVEYWARAFGNRLHPIMRPENGYYGNSYNILQAYKKAYDLGVETVYLIEDDVLVTPDFFTWHNSVQSDHYFCTIAGQCYRNQVPSNSESFESANYASLGVCWKRDKLKFVIEHATEDYYQNQTTYILQKFPNSKLGLFALEQDGLIQRIMEQQFQKALFASKPRAFHVGVYGYHRGIGVENMFTGSLSNRIEAYRKAVSDPGWLGKVAGFQSDVQAFPLQ